MFCPPPSSTFCLHPVLLLSPLLLFILILTGKPVSLRCICVHASVADFCVLQQIPATQRESKIFSPKESNNLFQQSIKARLEHQPFDRNLPHSSLVGKSCQCQQVSSMSLLSICIQREGDGEIKGVYEKKCHATPSKERKRKRKLRERSKAKAAYQIKVRSFFYYSLKAVSCPRYSLRSRLNVSPVRSKFIP